MRDATFERSTSNSTSTLAWRELYRCDDLRQARAVAACIGAMEFDVRLSSHNDGVDEDRDFTRHRPHDRAQSPATPIAGTTSDDADPIGPYIVEVHDSTWPQLADVLLEIITEQQEFDELVEWRRQRHQRKLVLVLSITTAAEVMLIWRLLES